MNIESQFSGKNFHIAVNGTEADLKEANRASNYLINARRRFLLAKVRVSEFLSGEDPENLGVEVSKAFFASPEDFNNLCQLFSDVDAEWDGKYLKGVPVKKFLEGVAIEYKRQAIERDMGV